MCVQYYVSFWTIAVYFLMDNRFFENVCLLVIALDVAGQWEMQ